MEALNKLNTIKTPKVTKFLIYQGLNLYFKNRIFTKNIQEVKHENILESTTDATEWKLEVERVLPQLKVTIKTDHKVN